MSHQMQLCFAEAVKKGHMDIAEWLLNIKNGGLNVNSSFMGTCSPLSWAARTKDIRLCKALLAHPETDVNFCGYIYPRSALIVACSVPNNAQVVRTLASHPGVNLNNKTTDCTTALQCAAQLNYVDNVRALLSVPGVSLSAAQGTKAASDLTTSAEIKIMIVSYAKSSKEGIPWIEENSAADPSPLVDAGDLLRLVPNADDWIQRLRSFHHFHVWMRVTEGLYLAKCGSIKREEWMKAATFGQTLSAFLSNSASVDALRNFSDEDYRTFSAQFDKYVNQVKDQCMALSVQEEYDCMKVVAVHLDAMQAELRALPSVLVERTMPVAAVTVSAEAAARAQKAALRAKLEVAQKTADAAQLAIKDITTQLLALEGCQSAQAEERIELSAEKCFIITDEKA